MRGVPGCSGGHSVAFFVKFSSSVSGRYPSVALTVSCSDPCEVRQGTACLSHPGGAVVGTLPNAPRTTVGHQAGSSSRTRQANKAAVDRPDTAMSSVSLASVVRGKLASVAF
ncbi:Hypp139 [Branchiostoma lanceolatum]|uniref:Hypp139 protein n=1 Tax=Branchiostoma lanceolatum TaxID=7740 RepID=A0A8J9V6I7_BRALA|nr:Hypp139 [Branchiostoma lanceolatum]